MCVIYATFMLIYSSAHIALLVMGIFLLLLPVGLELQLYYIRKKSYICLTSDEIIVNVWSRKTIRYPLSQVEKVQTVDFDNDPSAPDINHYRLPLAFGRGGEIIPSCGVLLYFNRAYLKSVLPIFFWPADPDIFADTLISLLSSPQTPTSKEQVTQLLP